MMRRKSAARIALLSILVLVAASCRQGGDAGGGGGGGGGGAQECPDTEFGCVEVGANEPIKLGTLLVISGPDAPLGLDSQHGVQIAVDMRDGQVAGHEISLVHQDDLCSAEGGQTGAQALAADPTITAVIGTSCSSAGEPASQILSDKGIVLISPSNTAPSLTDPETHQPFYLRTAHNDKIQGAAMAQFVAEELGHKTAATIHDGSPYAEQLQQVFADTFSQEHGGEVTAQEAVQVGEKDFKPVLTSIGTTNPDFVYYPIFIAEGALVTRQARQTAELKDADLGGADGMFSPDWIEAAGPENAEGVYLSGPDLEFQGSFYQEEFLPAYEEKFGEPTAVFHAHAFDATNMLLDAIEEVAIKQPDGGLLIPRTELKDALFGTQNYEGIIGNLSCNETGDCNPDATISVSQVQNGDFKRIWP